MRILITGADQPLGLLAARALRGEHQLRLAGSGALAPVGFDDLPYSPSDLREPEQAERLVERVDAILHLQPYAVPEITDSESEKQALDVASRGTFVLLHAALKAGVQRVVMASRLELMAAYPESHLVDETWKAMPDATAASLSPFLAELTLREFVRAESLLGICLRLGELGNGREGTTPADAVRALQSALTMDVEGRKYRWWLYHIGSTDRFPLGTAAHAPLNFARTGG